MKLPADRESQLALVAIILALTFFSVCIGPTVTNLAGIAVTFVKIHKMQSKLDALNSQILSNNASRNIPSTNPLPPSPFPQSL